MGRYTFIFSVFFDEVYKQWWCDCRWHPHNTMQITAMAFSSDGSTLSTGDSSGIINIWDLASAQVLTACEAHQGPVWSLSYSHGEGKVLASGGSDCTLKLWSEHKSSVGGGPINASTVSVDGLTRLATWYTKKTPVVMTRFTRKDLLFGAGPLSIPAGE